MRGTCGNFRNVTLAFPKRFLKNASATADCCLMTPRSLKSDHVILRTLLGLTLRYIYLFFHKRQVQTHAQAACGLCGLPIDKIYFVPASLAGVWLAS